MKTIVIEKICPICGSRRHFKLEHRKYLRWTGGEFVQDVWPKMSLTDRECLISGICSDECFDEALGEPEPERRIGGGPEE